MNLLKVWLYWMLACTVCWPGKWFVVLGFGFLNLKSHLMSFFSEVVMKSMRTEWKWWRSLQCVSLNINHIRKLKNTHFKKIIFRSSKWTITIKKFIKKVFINFKTRNFWLARNKKRKNDNDIQILGNRKYHHRNNWKWSSNLVTSKNFKKNFLH